MTKIIAIVVAGMFATGAVFAGEHGDCTKKVGNSDKPACSVNMASLNLTADQKTKMDAAMAEHHKAGCSEASEAKYMQEAKTILNKDQFAKFKAECKEMKDKEKGEGETKA
jgi:Spy/CpxP family protein refolding chaperone